MDLLEVDLVLQAIPQQVAPHLQAHRLANLQQQKEARVQQAKIGLLAVVDFMEVVEVDLWAVCCYSVVFLVYVVLHWA